MIRFVFGLFLIMGAAGGLEMNTATWTEFFLGCGFGISLILWALPKLVNEEYNEY
jgi:hypothetical protein